MYNPGDYAVVSRYGVCRIVSVGHPSLSPVLIHLWIITRFVLFARIA